MRLKKFKQKHPEKPKLIKLISFYSDLATLNNNNSHTINQNQINHLHMQLKDNNNEKDQMMIDQNQDQPDSDYIKMFVGQVPRSMDEGKT